MPIEHGKFGSGVCNGGIAFAVALLLAGCATPKVVESVQPKDASLDCAQLLAEAAEAEKLRLAAEGAEGTTGGNLLKGFLFFPALLVSYDNVKTATKAAEARKTHLADLSGKKRCPPPQAKPGAKPPAR